MKYCPYRKRTPQYKLKRAIRKFVTAFYTPNPLFTAIQKRYPDPPGILIQEEIIYENRYKP